jgi:hypothetical protein
MFFWNDKCYDKYHNITDQVDKEQPLQSYSITLHCSEKLRWYFLFDNVPMYALWENNPFGGLFEFILYHYWSLLTLPL